MLPSSMKDHKGTVDYSVIVPAPARPPGSALSGIKHVIAVGSGKGGVGKSTTAVNLAAALSKLGAKVGLMDADIYGPSVPRLLSSGGKVPLEKGDVFLSRPTENAAGKIVPPEAFGMKCMSMALLGQEGPVVWRGPMASKAVSQFLGEVDWGELDYLIVDLPPGTGDIQITLAQAARLSGAIIVMTPQMLAVDIAKRGLKMFEQVRVPVLGIVENMASYECPSCGDVSHIFKSGGGQRVSEDLKIPLLESFPLDPKLVEESDSGTPVVLDRPDSKLAEQYFNLARGLATELRKMYLNPDGSGLRPVVYSMEPNEVAKAFKVIWSDGKQSIVSFRDLRFQCPCASCVDENTGKRTIEKDKISQDIKPLRVQTVGNYAISINWSDGHSTGIYSYDFLRKILVFNP